MTTTMAYHAASRGIEIEAIDIESEGDIDLRGFLGLSDKIRKGYQYIRVREHNAPMASTHPCSSTLAANVSNRALSLATSVSRNRRCLRAKPRMMASGYS